MEYSKLPFTIDEDEEGLWILSSEKTEYVIGSYIPVANVGLDEDAEYIVEACNNYPKLQDTLKEMVEALEQSDNMMLAIMRYAGNPGVLEAEHNKAVAALIKAKELIK